MLFEEGVLRRIEGDVLADHVTHGVSLRHGMILYEVSLFLRLVEIFGQQINFSQPELGVG
jgi:hypothetical protein